MTIVTVTHYFESHRGGVEIVAGELARALVRAGVRDVTWIASDATAEPAGFPGTAVPVPAWNAVERSIGVPVPLWGGRAIRELDRAIRRADVVLLHDTLYVGNVLAFLIARRLGRPVVVVQHIGDVPYRNPLVRVLMRVGNRTVARALLSRADRVVFISETTKRFFSGFTRFRRDPLVLFNGVDADTFRPPATEEERGRARRELSLAVGQPVVAFVGRFVEKKGLPVIRELARRLSPVQWVLAGWGPVDPLEWGLGNVRVESGRSGEALRSVYHAADLLVLPSVGEGFPLVIQEALACGTQVLASEETAAADESLSGRIAAAPVNLDDPEATAEAWRPLVETLIDRPFPDEGRRELATFARERYSWSATAVRYREILAELASRR